MFNNSLEKNRYSLRKLSVGLASVLIGISFIETNGQTAKADTVTDGTNTAAISTNIEKTANSAGNAVSDANKGTTASNGSLDATGSANAGQESIKENGSQNYNANDSAEATAAKTEAVKGTIIAAKAALDAEIGTQKANTPVTNHLESVVQPKASVASNGAKPNATDSATLTVVRPSEIKLAKPVVAKVLAESKVATGDQFNFNDWTTQIDNTYLNITGYKGDRSKQIVVPNGADFAKAGKNDQNLQVEIDEDTLKGLIVNDVAPKLSNTDGQKIVAKGNDWSYAFSWEGVHDISGLANLDTSNVTNMAGMFEHNSISDLSPLASWNTDNVTNMGEMFWDNQISNLSPLANWNTGKVTDMSKMFEDNYQIRDLRSLANWNTSNVTNMGNMFDTNQISDLSPLANWKTGKVTDMSYMFWHNSISDLTPLANWDTSKVTDMNTMFGENHDLKDLKPIANWNMSSVSDWGLDDLFTSDTQLNLTDINNTKLMQAFLKAKSALRGAIFITNNTDLVKAVVDQNLPTLTNTAKRTIVFNIPHATPETVTQTINYKAIASVQIYWPAQQVIDMMVITSQETLASVDSDNPDQADSDGPKIIKTYSVKDVKASDWQLDASKHNDAIIVNGQIRFASVKIPHVNGYKAYIVRNKSNPALFTVSFMAIPTKNKPSTPVEETPLKPSAPIDNPNKPSNDLQQRTVTKLNSNNSSWTMPTDVSTCKVEVPVNNIAIDLSDLVITQPVHAQTHTRIHVNKRFKLRKHGKKHIVKHLKHRKKALAKFKKNSLKMKKIIE